MGEKLNLETLLLAWYDLNHRHLPWRANPGQTPNPYHVLLSEIMLQQTTVTTVIEYFNRFIHKWPRLEDFATASLEEVYHQWQGLGYYARARNLHRCVQEIVENHGALIPSSEEKLRQMPGIGPYTAAAVASIAFDEPTVPVDGNIIRVFSRLMNDHTLMPGLKKNIDKAVLKAIPSKRSGDFAQALMDLGATICKPTSPECNRCPVQGECKAFEAVQASSKPPFQIDDLPKKPQKIPLPQKYGIVFWYGPTEDHVWVRPRPSKGLLANLMEIPSTSWQEEELPFKQLLKESPDPHKNWKHVGSINHTFTHFRLRLHVFKALGDHKGGEILAKVSELSQYAFPTLMKKVIKIACEKTLI